MNKWQIICPLVAMAVAALLFTVMASLNMRRDFVMRASLSIGRELISATNSQHLIQVSPDLQARMAELLASPTRISSVVLGDMAPPMSDGKACSRLVLTNDAGRGLLIRLSRAEQSGKFRVLDYSSSTKSIQLP